MLHKSFECNSGLQSPQNVKQMQFVALYGIDNHES